MDVRCERCRAQYVFDDAQVTEAGLAVKCSNCGHLFKVKKKALVVTVPLKPGEATETPITATSAPAVPAGNPGAPPGSTPPASPLPAEKREWRVRQANGNVFTFKELTTLQKWIVEKKVARDDEISLSGDQWKRLGNIAELATFFQVVEAAERGQAGPLPALTPLPMPPPVYPTTGAYPLGYPPGFAPPAPGYPQATPVPLQPGVSPPVSGSIQVNVGAPPGAAWESQPPAAPRAAAREPAWAAGGRRALPDAELDDEDLKAVKGGGGKFVLAVVLLLLAGGGAAAWLLKPEWLAAVGLRSPPPAPPPPPAPVVQAPPPAKPEPPAPAPAPTPAAAPEPLKAEPPPAPVEKAPEMVKEAPPPPPPHSKGVKQMLAEAQRMRERGKVEKALDLYGRIVELHPDNAQALAGRGWCYLDLSQYPPAEASFQAALEEDPTHGEALIGLAETYRYQGRRAEAVGYYRKYLAAHPDGEDAVAARNALGQLKE
jgi:lactobin A/cerein 7B family class IIb bacteriocin